MGCTKNEWEWDVLKMSGNVLYLLKEVLGIESPYNTSIVDACKYQLLHIIFISG